MTVQNSKYKQGLGKTILLLSLFLAINVQLIAQDSSLVPPLDDIVIFPGPVPFSLDAESAVYCINLLKNNRFIEDENDTDNYRIIVVKTVWSFFLDFDESYPEGHRRRYDIIVNEVPMDWENSYIEYGGEMLNLRLLFLYRNQYPPETLDYYYNPAE